MVAAAVLAGCAGQAAGPPSATFSAARWKADVAAEDLAAESISFECARAADSPAELKATEGPTASHLQAIGACLMTLQQSQAALRRCRIVVSAGAGPASAASRRQLETSIAALFPALDQAIAAVNADDPAALTAAKNRIADLQGHFDLEAGS